MNEPASVGKADQFSVQFVTSKHEGHSPHLDVSEILFSCLLKMTLCTNMSLQTSRTVRALLPISVYSLAMCTKRCTVSVL